MSVIDLALNSGLPTSKVTGQWGCAVTGSYVMTDWWHVRHCVCVRAATRQDAQLLLFGILRSRLAKEPDGASCDAESTRNVCYGLYGCDV